MHVICILILFPFCLISPWSHTKSNGNIFSPVAYDLGSHVFTPSFCAVGMLLSMIVFVNTSVPSM